MNESPQAAAVRNAFAAFELSVASDAHEEAHPLAYAPSTALLDDHHYSVNNINARSHFSDDSVITGAIDADQPLLEIAMLAVSPHWEDRVRAAVVRASIGTGITLPDDFPCIYEPADSPKKAGLKSPRPSAWVISADEAMLHELLPLYQELWDAYESQWHHSPNRTFKVGRLSGLSPYSVYRPGTTPAAVIGQTMLVHSDMYRTAPEHLRRMHPRFRLRDEEAE